ncbi:MAG: DUF2147 domain-containing protein [Leptospirales bacterium]|nr:DUF2147 domain-containing protein [Leptospirales bacterium]
MKPARRILWSLVLLIVSFPALLRAEPQDITGQWLVADGFARIKIEPCADRFCGKVSWLRKLTDKNRPVLGMTVLSDFSYQDGRWIGGRIFDPETMRTYDCRMWLEGSQVLVVRGYLGLPLFGREERWTRVE